MSMLKIHNLTVAYAERVALRAVSLEVPPGQILALIGPNGAGKTTLIRALSGLIAPQKGEMYAAGQDLARISPAERARLLAVVPQARQLGGAFTVEQAVMMGRTAYMGWLGQERVADRQAVLQALQRTQLEDFANRTIASLSGGEQQRVLLARALAQSTPVLLLDEPTNHLDLQHQTKLLGLVRQLAHEQQLTVVMALHDLNLVSLVADRVALLVKGELQHLGSPSQVLKAENLSQAYLTEIEIVPHPVTQAPLVYPRGLLQVGSQHDKPATEQGE
ncbi:MAG: ABC transporter ATP-binding protein [Anaerolineales bacterium]|nr:ABC transporter ATP-binding protein [Anaerolineales bacterium]